MCLIKPAALALSVTEFAIEVDSTVATMSHDVTVTLKACTSAWSKTTTGHGRAAELTGQERGDETRQDLLKNTTEKSERQEQR